MNHELSQDRTQHRKRPRSPQPEGSARFEIHRHRDVIDGAETRMVPQAPAQNDPIGVVMVTGAPLPRGGRGVENSHEDLQRSVLLSESRDLVITAFSSLVLATTIAATRSPPARGPPRS